ncbi:MAG: TIGR00296 family protein [Nitrososphaerota archaeon]|nr:TIGR00296 family protein [Nitrososphaerota archaeon]
MPVPDEAGRKAVKLARSAIDARVSGKGAQGTPDEHPFTELRGVFVTINRAEQVPDRLRGCIGFPYPVKPLGAAIRDAAVAAATEDPRFPPVVKSELGSVVVEVSILTPPEPLSVQNRRDLPSKVRIGEDGLIVSRHGFSGLLLPQVATEFGMDQTEFLSQACMKAGLPPDSWLDSETEVQTFQAEIFAEEAPGGKVLRHASA